MANGSTNAIVSIDGQEQVVQNVTISKSKTQSITVEEGKTLPVSGTLTSSSTTTSNIEWVMRGMKNNG